MSSQLNLNALRVFVQVAESGSFTAAAQALDLPTSNVSRYVAQLERQIGQRLLERSSRQLRLTSVGQGLFDTLQPWWGALRQAEQDLLDQRTRLSGRLRICIPSEVGPVLFAGALADFASQHPDLELHCQTNLEGPGVLMQDFDLALLMCRGALPDSSLVVQPLCSFDCQVVAAPALIEQYGMPSSLEELEHLPCITTDTALDGQAWQFVLPDGRFHVLNVSSRFRVNSGLLAGAGAVKGLGFAILARQGCETDIAQGRLVPVPLPLSPAPLRLVLAYTHRRHLSNSARALIEYLKEQGESGTLPGLDTN
ncbi:MAG: LysR family transcriptional regulator [Alcaligenes faecalis]|jgi:DNA-binding transcriptional LysR family regulator|uniref:LysR family transcriptional regulator n=1 Tax=Alcaligenes TaxID=507 RepID=UPI000D52A9DD|nr:MULTISPECIES: LysR family transcriptional regulator [Alcaligenes]AWG34509.1 LysR family transcriptional regulator [Alcaligenes aquatilis]MCC9162655.1 LysR family transcriptional regulator [Alcaligenes sp. MMA]MCH4223394.1 LysR family transcriptional regulator [Alcaligenes faecalis]QXR37735.1 LysR family transcriptional regulator [Alcaligenes aquatilis]UYY89035.1 LysR family transcriptional regulator [Alcaligenes sp. SMD-FA]